MLDKAGKNFSN